MVSKQGRRLTTRTRLRTGNLATTDSGTLHGDVDPVTAETGVTGETGETIAIDIELGLTL